MTPTPEKIDSFATIPNTVMDNIADAIKLDSDLAATQAHIPNATEAVNGLGSSNNIPKANVSVDNSVKSSPTKLGSIVGGELATNLLDLAIPALIVVCVRYVGYQINKSKLELTKKDREVIAPAMQTALDAIDINFNNPFINLAVVLSVVYGIKIIEEIPDIEKFIKPQKKLPPASLKVVRDEPTRIDVEDITPEIPEIPVAEYDFKPETKFKDELNDIIEKVVKSGKRKSRAGALGFLKKEEPDVIPELMRKYNIQELPEEFK